MSRRVQTGCSNCKRCTNSAVGEGARKAGRATIGLLTMGGSELVMAGTRNCRACGHKMNLHANLSAPAPAAADAWTPSAGAPSAPRAPDRARSEAAAVRLEDKAAKLESKASLLDSQAAGCDESTRLGRADAKNKRNMAKGYRDRATRFRASADALRAAQTEPSAAETASASSTELAGSDGTSDQSALGLAEQLSRLASLRDAGVLNDDEFAAAKALLLS